MQVLIRHSRCSATNLTRIPTATPRRCAAARFTRSRTRAGRVMRRCSGRRWTRAAKRWTSGSADLKPLVEQLMHDRGSRPAAELRIDRRTVTRTGTRRRWFRWFAQWLRRSRPTNRSHPGGRDRGEAHQSPLTQESRCVRVWGSDNGSGFKRIAREATAAGREIIIGTYPACHHR